MHYFQNLYFSQKGVIATICFDEKSHLKPLNRTTWSQAFPLAHPLCGVVRFLFSSKDNSLEEIELYHADQCLPEYLIEHASFFRDDDYLPIEFEAEFYDILRVRFSKDEKYSGIQRFSLRPPAKGYASVTFTAENKIREFYLTGCLERSMNNTSMLVQVQPERVIDVV